MNTNQNNSTDIIVDFFIDITTDTCPMTFVKTKLKIEKMETGEVLEVLLNNGEPLKNVPLSAEELGHKVLYISDQSNEGTHTIFIKKA